MKKTVNKKKKSLNVAERLTKMYSSTDIDGSYTGCPKNRDESPIQDVDDL